MERALRMIVVYDVLRVCKLLLCQAVVDLIARLFFYLPLMFSFACLIVVNPNILVAMEVIRFLSGLCYSFPSPSRSHFHA